MIENIRTHPYTRAVCLKTARLFERRAAKDLVQAQHWADGGVSDRAREFQSRARLAQARANAWHLRAKNAPTNNEPRANAALKPKALSRPAVGDYSFLPPE
jgi:hypothetical protein